MNFELIFFTDSFYGKIEATGKKRAAKQDIESFITTCSRKSKNY